jgi:hypothetical protein
VVTKFLKEKIFPVLRSWTAIAAATIAFILSVAQAYYSFILEKDDLRLVISQIPYVMVDPHTHRLSVRGAGSLLFANYGNSPAPIVRIALTVAQPVDPDARDNQALCSGTTELVNYDLDSVILKPGELVAARVERFMKVDEAAGTVGKDGSVSVALSSENQKRDNKWVRLCWTFVTLAYDRAYKSDEIPVAEFELPKKEGDLAAPTLLFHPSIPIVLEDRRAPF